MHLTIVHALETCLLRCLEIDQLIINHVMVVISKHQLSCHWLLAWSKELLIRIIWSQEVGQDGCESVCITYRHRDSIIDLVIKKK